QAEDGIRVFHVTGVQTCALPILRSGASGMKSTRSSVTATVPVPHTASAADPTDAPSSPASSSTSSGRPLTPSRSPVNDAYVAGQIGRASCRERVLVAGIAI